MEEIKKEKFISTSTNPIFIEGGELIISQMKKSTCKIHLSNGQQNTGFFCKIPYPDQAHSLFALVTCSFIITKEFLNEGNIIHISTNDDKEFREIRVNNTRKVFINNKFAITILELKPEDKIDNYLEIDENVFKDDKIIKDIYKNASIYVLHYLKGNKVACSSGLIQEVVDGNIIHLCNTESGSSGGPILSLDTFKVIGIHVGASTDNNFNKGVFIKFPIVEFIKTNIGH